MKEPDLNSRDDNAPSDPLHSPSRIGIPRGQLSILRSEGVTRQHWTRSNHGFHFAPLRLGPVDAESTELTRGPNQLETPMEIFVGCLETEKMTNIRQRSAGIRNNILILDLTKLLGSEPASDVVYSCAQCSIFLNPGIEEFPFNRCDVVEWVPNKMDHSKWHVQCGAEAIKQSRILMKAHRLAGNALVADDAQATEAALPTARHGVIVPIPAPICRIKLAVPIEDHTEEQIARQAGTHIPQYVRLVTHHHFRIRVEN